MIVFMLNNSCNQSSINVGLFYKLFVVIFNCYFFVSILFPLLWNMIYMYACICMSQQSTIVFFGSLSCIIQKNCGKSLMVFEWANYCLDEHCCEDKQRLNFWSVGPITIFSECIVCHYTSGPTFWIACDARHWHSLQWEIHLGSIPVPMQEVAK